MSLAEQAAGLLPPQRPGMPHDVVRGERVWRLVESFQTPAGFSATLAVVSFADGDSLALQINDLLDAGRTPHPPSLIVHRQQMLTGSPLPLSLPGGAPETFSVLWTHSHSKVIGQVRQVTLAVPDEETPLIFRSPPANSPPTQPQAPADVQAGLAVLRAGCSSAAPGTVFWQKNMLTGIAAAEITGWQDDLPAEGAFFVPGSPEARKPFHVKLSRDANSGDVHGVLETVKGTGIAGRPTQAPSTLNLLLRDATARFDVRLYGHELFGDEIGSPVFKLSIVPVRPDPSIVLE